MKGDLSFGIDLGSDSLKTGFAYEGERGNFRYGKLAVSFFDDTFPACGYCTPDTDEWIFGEEIFSENKDYERIVRIKDLIMLYDGTDSCDYFKTNYDYPKFKPRFIEESFAAFDKRKTFRSASSPKEVAEQFFQAYFRQFFAPALEKLAQRYSLSLGSKLGSNAILAIPDNARDEYAVELTRLASLGGFVSVKTKGFKTRRVSETAALYAVNEKKLVSGERALVADVGETGLTLSVVDGIDLEEYLCVWKVGGADADQNIFDYVKAEIDKKRGTQDENYGTYYQLFNLELRIKDAKATLSTAGSKRTRVEVEGATTELVPLTTEAFLEATKPTTKRVSDLITSAAKKAKLDKIILSGGAAQTRGLLTALKAANKTRNVVIHGEFVADKATDLFDVYDRGTEFAPAIGAALFATKKFRSVSRAPRSYGVKTMDRNRPVCSIIVKKNTKLPVTVSRSFVTLGATRNIETTLYATDETVDLPLLDDFTIQSYLKEGKIVEKDKDCQAWFPQIVPAGYPLILQIRIDGDGVGEIHAFDGRTNREIEWRGRKFSTGSDFGRAK